MPEPQHPMERRTDLIAQGLKDRVSMLADMMLPNGRRVYTTQLNDQKALEFWQKHRFDDMGKAVLATWSPSQVLQLDTRLMQAQQSEGTPP